MARAPVPSELVEDIENDFSRLMEQRRDFVGDDDDAATVVADDPFLWLSSSPRLWTSPRADG